MNVKSRSFRSGIRLSAAAIGLLIVVSTSATPLAQRAVRNRQILATILDREGQPAQNVAAADLTVRENDIAREVLSVSRATDAMQIALLIDTSAAMQPALQDVRTGVQAFVQAILTKSPDSQIAIWSFGERPKVEADFTSTMAGLQRGIGRLFPITDSGAFFLEAVTEAAGKIKKRTVVRPVIAAFVVEDGPEFSDDTPEYVAAALKNAGASLWAIALQARTSSLTSDGARYRSTVMADVTTGSGGAREMIATPIALTDAFKSLADRLLSQYVITYGRPESMIPPERLDVSAKREGLRVLAPHWTGK